MAEVPASAFQTMFMVGAPQAAPHSWNLSLDAFATDLRSRDPDAFLRLDADPFLGDSLHFGFTHTRGTAEGIATTSPDGAAIKDCTAAEATEFAIWLRDHIVPKDAETEFTIRPAAEVGQPTRRLPDGDAAAIEQALGGYVADVIAARERDEM